MKQTVKAIADIFEFDLAVDVQNEVPCHATREGAPLSMYEDNNFLLANAFPTIFLLGKTYRANILQHLFIVDCNSMSHGCKDIFTLYIFE